MFIYALLIIANICNQPTYLSKDEKRKCGIWRDVGYCISKRNKGTSQN